MLSWTEARRLYTNEAPRLWPDYLVNSADTTIVTARIDAALKAKLEALARSTKRSKSFLAAEAIAAYVELNEWQIAEIKAGIAELDSGKILSEAQAEKRYRRLLKPR